MKTIRIKPDGAMVKRFMELKAENMQMKQDVDKALVALNDRRNKLVLQNAHYWKVEGFDLAIDVFKSIHNSQH